jgi:hypothetical protein
MNILLIGSLLIVFIYFIFYKKESFNNINIATESIAHYFNHDNDPSFIKYSTLLNNLHNTSEKLIMRDTFNHFLDIKKNRMLKSSDIIEKM